MSSFALEMTAAVRGRHAAAKASWNSADLKV
jgi:hypothetical protein